MGSCPVVGRGFPHPNEELTPEWLIVCKLLASKTLRKVSLGQKIAPCELADAMDTETIQRESQENSPDHLRHGQARLSRWSDLRTVKTPAGAAASLRRN